MLDFIDRTVIPFFLSLYDAVGYLGVAIAIGPIVGGLYGAYALVLAPTLDVGDRRDRALLAGSAVLAALLPGTDPVTMTAEYVPMLALYWLSYFLVKAVEPKKKHGLTDFLSEPSP